MNESISSNKMWILCKSVPDFVIVIFQDDVYFYYANVSFSLKSLTNSIYIFNLWKWCNSSENNIDNVKSTH